MPISLSKSKKCFTKSKLTDSKSARDQMIVEGQNGGNGSPQMFLSLPYDLYQSLFLESKYLPKHSKT